MKNITPSWALLLIAMSVTITTTGLVTGCSSTYTRSNISPPREGELTYRVLMIKDYDEMNKIVRRQVLAAQKEFENGDEGTDIRSSAGLLELKKGLRVVLSRPNSDNMVAKLVPELRRELLAYDAYTPMMNELAKDGIRAFDPKMGMATVTLSTYAFMLENLMSEIQAEARENMEVRGIIQMIADANLRMPEDVIRERKMAGMFRSVSPSDLAKKILERFKTK